MVSIKQEGEDSVLQETKNETSEDKGTVRTETKPEPKYFQCEVCALRECYDYFGNDPPFVKRFKLAENAYVIEDPFVPPKQNEFIVLGSHCIRCGKAVCKDSNCSLYYEGTFCIFCAKNSVSTFPENVKEKLNKIVV